MHVATNSVPLTRTDWSHFIDNGFTDIADSKMVEVWNPATGEVLGKVVDGTPADVDRAVRSADLAQKAWSKVPIRQRAAAVLAIADLIEEHGEELAMLDTLDNGSPLKMMRGDITLTLTQMRYLAGLALQMRGETIPTDDPDTIDFTTQQPFGVVGRIIPFNHPFMFAATKTVVPLITGNTVVLKPSMETPLSALRFAELAARVLPPGVLNVVTGRGSVVGDAIVSHPDVPRIAFIGSVEVGLEIQRRAATDTVKVVSLELGGKNPLVVFPDADLEAAVAGAVKGMNFTWQGQSCGSTSRIYVHKDIWEPFLKEMETKLSSLQVGDPLAETTDVGAIVSRRQFDTVCSFLREGENDERARLVVGGVESENSAGGFIRPTLFAYDDGPGDSRLVHEEIFGPIVVALPFSDYDEVITAANQLDVGLTASVWTSNLSLAMQASRDLEAGYVWVNESSMHVPGAPYGGVKNSGIGREEGIEEYYSFTQQKNIYINFKNNQPRPGAVK